MQALESLRRDEVPAEEALGALQLERGHAGVAAGIGMQRLLPGGEGAEKRHAGVARDQLVVPLQQELDRDADLGR